MDKNKKPGDLTKGSPKNTPALSESDLDKVSGGATNKFLKIDGVDGESTDDKHKGEIYIGS
jgi:hypothetical protein